MQYAIDLMCMSDMYAVHTILNMKVMFHVKSGL